MIRSPSSIGLPQPIHLRSAISWWNGFNQLPYLTYSLFVISP